jgi:hypothetical protein
VGVLVLVLHAPDACVVVTHPRQHEFHSSTLVRNYLLVTELTSEANVRHYGNNTGRGSRAQQHLL